MGCLNCGNELKHTPGRKKKKFCSNLCRSLYWQKNEGEKKGLPLPADYINIKEIGIVREDGTVEKLFKPTNKTQNWERAFRVLLELSKREVSQSKPPTELEKEKPAKAKVEKREPPETPKIDAGDVPPKTVIKKTYNQWLNLARELDLEGEISEFKKEVLADTSLTGGQRSMIFSKLKTK